jgi:diguanylate cyclase (GGDEF)-like protein
MHYIGMRAYLVDAVLWWDATYVSVSWMLSIVFAAIAIGQSVREAYRHAEWVALVFLTLAVVGLHFTGMASLLVLPNTIGSVTDPAVLIAMAVAVAGGAIVIVSTGIVSHLIDEDATKENVEHLKFLALYDNLTRLPNRAAFVVQFSEALQKAGRDGSRVAVIGIDLNRFKEVNDTRGHVAGDKVLRALGDRFNRICLPGECVARIGGDEFSAFKRIGAEEDLSDFLDSLEACIRETIFIDDGSVSVGASMGIAIFPQDGRDVETLINNADLAMYRAKREVAKARCYYDPAMDEAARRRRNLAEDLRGALGAGQLHLAYQVQVRLADGAAVGYEALLRWTHPSHGTVSPAEFIPLAEQSGIIVPIGEWVLRTACREAASWPDPMRIAINISAVQFAHSDLASLVHSVLLETGLRPSRLELEITESTLIADKPLALRTLRTIRALGVTVAIDDFGTGYSSLDTLRSFPFDRIKLDRSFLSDVTSNVETRAIIRAMLAVGNTLRVIMLAEGVETQAQLDLLRSDGCDEAQGYYLGRPGSLANTSRDLTAWLGPKAALSAAFKQAS